MCYGCNNCNKCGKLDRPELEGVRAIKLRCTRCGEPLPDGTARCPACGAVAAPPPGTSAFTLPREC